MNSKAKTARKYSTVFYRGNSDSELDLSGLPKNSRGNIKIALEKQVLIISLGAKLKISKCKAIRDWFMINEFADFGDPVTNFSYHADCQEALWMIRMFSRRLWNTLHLLMNILRIFG